MKRQAQEKPRIGGAAEYAIWLDGTETAQQRAQFELECRVAMKRFADTHKVMLSPVTFTEKRPGEDRVPKVPDNIQGPDVRLLVAEANVLANAPTIVLNSFLGDLDKKDLDRLRAITRRVHAKERPLEPSLTDEQCDRLIEEIGPEAALDAIRNAVNGQTIH